MSGPGDGHWVTGGCDGDQAGWGKGPLSCVSQLARGIQEPQQGVASEQPYISE